MPLVKKPHQCLQCNKKFEQYAFGATVFFCSNECSEKYEKIDEWTKKHMIDSFVGLECPYCGHMHKASDYSDVCYQDDASDFQCDQCHRIFEIETYQSWSWKTLAKHDQYNPDIDGKDSQ